MRRKRTFSDPAPMKPVITGTDQSSVVEINTKRSNKMGFQEGQRVKFRRSHDKAIELTGTIVKVHENSDLVDVATEPDGKILEVETIETAHTADVTSLEE